MNIASALKQKNRLVGEINRKIANIKKFNCYASNNPPAISVDKLIEEAEVLRAKLIELKAKISFASASLAPRLVELAERKSEFELYNSLTIFSGIVTPASDNTNEVLWVSFVDENKRSVKLEVIQSRINELQDEIDIFNAKTEI